MNTKLAREIMTKDVLVAHKDDSISNVAKLLINQKVGGLPVVDKDNKVVGIISETDIIKKEKNIEPPHYLNILQGIVYLEDFKNVEKDIKRVAAYKVEDLMSTEIVKVYEDNTVDEVANIMIKKSINRVPVVGENMELRGIICRYDIIKAIYS